MNGICPNSLLCKCMGRGFRSTYLAFFALSQSKHKLKCSWGAYVCAGCVPIGSTGGNVYTR